jgi:hypothetical protein
MGRVVAIRRRKGQLQAMIFGWGRWYNVENVVIEVRFALPPQIPSRSTPFHQGQAAPAEAAVIGGKG